MLIDILKQRYPNPVTAEENSGGYCVGGALGFEFGHTDPFPRPEILAAILEDANPKLMQNDLAIDYAYDIIESNDAELFEDAWEKLEEAINYG